MTIDNTTWLKRLRVVRNLDNFRKLNKIWVALVTFAIKGLGLMVCLAKWLELQSKK